MRPTALRSMAMVIAVAGACSRGEKPAPLITAFEPKVATQLSRTKAVLEGMHLLADVDAEIDSGDTPRLDVAFEVYIDGTSAQDVVWALDDAGVGRLQLTIPKGLPLGKHPVMVRTPAGHEAVLDDAVEIVEAPVGLKFDIFSTATPTSADTPIDSLTLMAGQQSAMHAVLLNGWGEPVEAPNVEVTWRFVDPSGDPSKPAPDLGSLPAPASPYFAAERMGSALISAQIVDAEGDSGTDRATTGLIKVDEPSESAQLVIRDAALQGGNVLHSVTLISGEQQVFYAELVDGFGNFVKNVTATWAVSEGASHGELQAVSASSTTAAHAMFLGKKATDPLLTDAIVIEATVPDEGFTTPVRVSVSIVAGPPVVVSITDDAFSPLTSETVPDLQVDSTEQPDPTRAVQLFAVGFDAFGNNTGLLDAAWTITHWGQANAEPAQLSQASGMSVSLIPRDDAGAVQISVLVTEQTFPMAASTPVITVQPGPASVISIESAPGGTGAVVADIGAASADGEAVTLYAVARDGFGNYVEDVAVDWTVGGSCSAFDGGGGEASASVTVSVNAGACSIDAVAADGSLAMTEPWVSEVEPGPAAQLLLAVDAVDGAGLVEGASLTLTSGGADCSQSGQSCTADCGQCRLFVSSVDSNGDPTAAPAVTWVTSGSGSVAVSAAQGSEIVVSAANVGTGSVQVQADGIPALTISTTVEPGAIETITVESLPAPSAPSASADALSLFETAQVTLHAVGWDAGGNRVELPVDACANIQWETDGGAFETVFGCSSDYVAPDLPIGNSASFSALVTYNPGGSAGPLTGSRQINVFSGIIAAVRIASDDSAVCPAVGWQPGAGDPQPTTDDDGLALWAVACDNAGQFLGHVPASWALVAPGEGVGSLSQTVGESVQLTLNRPGGATITASFDPGDAGGVREASVAFVVMTGLVESMEIVDRDSSEAFGATVAMTAGETLALRARARDADGNPVTLSETDVTWGVSGEAGVLTAADAIETDFEARRAGSDGAITLRYAGGAGAQGGVLDGQLTLNISPGPVAAVHVYRIFPESQNALPLLLDGVDLSLTADDVLTLDLRGEDAYGNATGVVLGAEWSLHRKNGAAAIGDLAVDGNTGVATLDLTSVGTAVVQGWTDDGGGLQAQSGEISVSPGVRVSLAVEGGEPLAPLGPLEISHSAEIWAYLVGRDGDGNITDYPTALWQVKPAVEGGVEVLQLSKTGDDANGRPMARFQTVNISGSAVISASLLSAPEETHEYESGTITVWGSSCGDGEVAGGEVCDWGAPAVDCLSVGYLRGANGSTAACDGSCTAWDMSMCGAKIQTAADLVQAFDQSSDDVEEVVIGLVRGFGSTDIDSDGVVDPVMLGSGLHISGKWPGLTLKTLPGQGAPATLVVASPIKIISDNVTFSKLKLRGSAAPIIEISGNNAALSRLQFINVSEAVAIVSNAVGTSVHQNHFYNGDGLGADAPTALVSDRGTGSLITANWFQNERAQTEAESVAIDADGAAGGVIAMNAIYGTFATGISVAGIGEEDPATLVDHNSLWLVDGDLGDVVRGVALEGVAHLCYRNNINYGYAAPDGGMGGSVGLHLLDVGALEQSPCFGEHALYGNATLGHAKRCGGSTESCTTLCGSTVDRGGSSGSLCGASLSYLDGINPFDVGDARAGHDLCPAPVNNPLIDGGGPSSDATYIYSNAQDLPPQRYDLYDGSATAAFYGEGPDVGAREAGVGRAFGGQISRCSEGQLVDPGDGSVTP